MLKTNVSVEILTERYFEGVCTETPVEFRNGEANYKVKRKNKQLSKGTIR